MSKIVVMNADILETEGLSIYEKMVFMVIRSFMNRKTGTAFPSYATIAKLGSMSRRKAIDVVKSLVEKGLIEKELRPIETVNDKQRHTSNLYVIEKPSTSEQYAPPSAPDAPSNSAQELPPSERHAPEQKNLKNKPVTNKRNNYQRSAQSLRSDNIPKWIIDQTKDKEPEITNKIDVDAFFAQSEKPADISRQAS